MEGERVQSSPRTEKFREMGYVQRGIDIRWKRGQEMGCEASRMKSRRSLWDGISRTMGSLTRAIRGHAHTETFGGYALLVGVTRLQQ
jgi:hypothetical protein